MKTPRRKTLLRVASVIALVAILLVPALAIEPAGTLKALAAAAMFAGVGMAVTANQLVKRQDGCKRSYPVEESTRIYQGSLVFVNAAGYACDVTATGVNAFVGVAIYEADNTDGADGAIEVEVWTEGDFELTLTGGDQAEVQSPIYADDNYACVVALGATSVRIGRIVRHVSSTKAIVAIQPCGVGALEVAPLTTISIADAAGTPDYAIQAVINSNAYGFASAAEAISTLYVIKNLQQRVLDLEARLK